MAQELSSSVAIKLYLCYVRPSLEYAAPVWHGSILENDAIKLERIQCSVARSLLKAEWNTPKETLLRILNWPSLRWRREVHAMLLFFNLLKRRPAPLSECLYPFAYSKSHRSLRKPYQLLLPYANSNKFVKSFFYRSALLWNSLPHKIQSMTSKGQFHVAIEEEWGDYKFNTQSNIPFSAFK